MQDTKDNITINKYGVSINLEEIKGRNYIMMLYLKVKIYAPKGLLPQKENINLTYEKKDQN